jgi:DNA-binding LacI/PurR family transcriptional regulator
MLHNTHNDSARETNYIQTISQRWIDGAIIVSTRNEVVGLDELSSARIPVVAINHTPSTYDGPSVTTDNFTAGRIAAEHLVGLGHIHLSHIGGPVRLYLSYEREMGFFEVLRESGLQPIICPNNAGEWDCESGFRAMTQLLDCAEIHPSAVFAANDRMAIGAMRAIHQGGLRVPQDISVIGMDDIEYSTYVSPPLTTVGQPIVKMALTAVDLLIKLLNGENPEKTRIVLNPELIVRGSTCPPSPHA